jgi:epoxyqueuosine reductase
MELEKKIKILGLKVGFDLVGITRLQPSQYQAQVETWVKEGHHGEMTWFDKNLARRLDPRKNLFGQGVSAITVGLLYRPVDIPVELRHDPSRGLIARYAWYDDYHQIMQKLLEELAEKIGRQIDNQWQYHIYIDTGPVLEREVGSRGGLGFVGKNTALINPTLGSYFFLGEIICDLPLNPDEKDKNQGTCGQCRRCQDKCPTQAFVSPFQLDARRCISYLTIEHSDEIPLALRPLIKNWIYGCDVCQEVCPWNKKAKDLLTDKIKYHSDLIAPPLEELLKINEADFAVRFKNSPIKRIGWARFMRNILIAGGNWGHKTLRVKLEYYTKHKDKLVANTAHWARQQIR